MSKLYWWLLIFVGHDPDFKNVNFEFLCQNGNDIFGSITSVLIAIIFPEVCNINKIIMQLLIMKYYEKIDCRLLSKFGLHFGAPFCCYCNYSSLTFSLQF